MIVTNDILSDSKKTCTLCFKNYYPFRQIEHIQLYCTNCRPLKTCKICGSLYMQNRNYPNCSRGCTSISEYYDLYDMYMTRPEFEDEKETMIKMQEMAKDDKLLTKNYKTIRSALYFQDLVFLYKEQLEKIEAIVDGGNRCYKCGYEPDFCDNDLKLFVIEASVFYHKINGYYNLNSQKKNLKVICEICAKNKFSIKDIDKLKKWKKSRLWNLQKKLK